MIAEIGMCKRDMECHFRSLLDRHPPPKPSLYSWRPVAPFSALLYIFLLVATASGFMLAFYVLLAFSISVIFIGVPGLIYLLEASLLSSVFWMYRFLRQAIWALRSDAHRELERDGRMPTVWLRSFRDDSDLVRPRRRWYHYLTLDGLGLLYIPPPPKRRLEEIAWGWFRRFGPFVAIGAPGEVAPGIGANRAYIDGENWQEIVKDWLSRANIIAISPSATSGTLWELMTIIENGLLERTIFVMPAASRKRELSAGALAQAFADSPWREKYSSQSAKEALVIIFSRAGRIVYLRGRMYTQDEYLLAVKIAHAMQTSGRKSI